MATEKTKTDSKPAADTSTPAATPAKTESTKAEGTKDASSAPANQSRGEGQKVVTQAYKDNWNAIFGKKKKAASKKTSKKVIKKTSKKKKR